MPERMMICGELACCCGATGWICHSGVRLGPKGPVFVDRIDSVSGAFKLISPERVRCASCGQVSAA